MYKAILIIFIILLSGCAQLTTKELITGKVTEDWVKVKGSSNTLKYSCPEFNIQVSPIEISSNKSSNSILFIPIVTDSSNKFEDLGYLFTIQILYSSGRDCSTNDLKFKAESFTSIPSSVTKQYHFDDLICLYTINLNNKFSELESIHFSEIENCTIPDLLVEMTTESTYDILQFQ